MPTNQTHLLGLLQVLGGLRVQLLAGQDDAQLVVVLEGRAGEGRVNGGLGGRTNGLTGEGPREGRERLHMQAHTRASMPPGAQATASDPYGAGSLVGRASVSVLGHVATCTQAARHPTASSRAPFRRPGRELRPGSRSFRPASSRQGQHVRGPSPACAAGVRHSCMSVRTALVRFYNLAQACGLPADSTLRPRRTLRKPAWSGLARINAPSHAP